MDIQPFVFFFFFFFTFVHSLHLRTRNLKMETRGAEFKAKANQGEVGGGGWAHEQYEQLALIFEI